MAKITKKDFFSDGFLNSPRFGREHLGVPSDPFEQVIMAARREAKLELPDFNEKARKEIAKQMAEDAKVQKRLAERHEQHQMELMAKKFADPIKNANKQKKDEKEKRSSNFLDNLKGFLTGEKTVNRFSMKDAKPEDNVSFNAVGKVRPGENPTEFDRIIAQAVNTSTLQASKARARVTGDEETMDAFYSDRAFGEGGGTDMLAQMLGYVGPGALLAGGLRAAGVGANVAKGASTGRKALQYGKEGAMVGAGIGIAETPGMALANPEMQALDHLKRIGLETVAGAVADPAIMGAVGLGKRGVNALDGLKSAIPDVNAQTYTPPTNSKTVEIKSPKPDEFTAGKIKERETAFVKEQRQALDGEAKRIQQKAKQDLGEFKTTLKNTEDSFVQSKLQESGYSNQVAQYDEVVKKSKGELDRIKSIVGDKIFIPKENRADFPEFPKGYISAKADGRYDIYKAAEVAGFGDDVEGFSRHMRNLLDASQTRKKDVVTLDPKQLELDARNEFKQTQEYKALQDTFNQIKKGYNEQISQYKNVTDEQLSSSFQHSDEYKAISNTLDQISSSGQPTPKSYAVSPKVPKQTQAQIKNVVDPPSTDKVKDIQVGWYDKNLSDTNTAFKVLDKEIFGTRSENLNAGLSYYKQAENLQRARGRAYDKIDRELKTSLRELTKKNGAYNEEQFYDYLMAKHYRDEITRNPDIKLPKGWDKSRIDNSIASNQGNKALDQAQKDYVRILRDSFKQRYESGLISKEFYENSIAKHENYMPMFRDIPEEDLFKVQPSYMPKTRNIDGSELEVIDPVKSAINQIMYSEVQASRNIFYKELEKLATNSKTSKYLKKVDNKDIGKPDTFTVFNNGEPTTYQVSEELGFALEHLSPKKSADLIEFVGKVTQTFKKGITDYNPFFYPVSTVRDGAQAVLNARDWTTKDMLSGVIAKDLAAGLLDAFLPQTWKKTFKITDYRSLYEGAGASHSQLIGGDMNTDKILKQIKDPKYASARKYLSLLPEMGRRAEMSTRLSVMRASARKGKSLEDQIHEAVDVTNYIRSGSMGKDLNKVSMFFNPSLRGIERNLEMFKDPKKIPMYVSKIAGLAMAPAALSAAIPYLPEEMTPGVTDDQRLKMKQLQDWEHNMFLHFPHWDGERIIRVHKPYFVGQLFMSPVQEMIRAQGEERSFEVERLAKDFFGTNMPPMAVSMLTPIMALSGALTKDPLTGMEIVPRRLEGREAKDQYDTSTLEMAKELGKLLDISPKKIDYVMRRTAGAVGDMSMSTLDYLMQEVGMLDKKTASTPEEEKWHRRLDIFLRSEYAGSGLTSDAYDAADKLNRERTSERGKIRDSIRASEVFADEKQIDKLLNKNNGFYEFGKEREHEKAQEVINQLTEFAMLARNIRANESLDSKEKDSMLKELRNQERLFNEENRQLINSLKGK